MSLLNCSKTCGFIQGNESCFLEANVEFVPNGKIYKAQMRETHVFILASKLIFVQLDLRHHSKHIFELRS